MTHQQKKWIILGGLLAAWGGVTLFQMIDTGDIDPMQTSIAGSPLPPIKDLSLEKTFYNPRQTAKFSTPRNIFDPLGMTEREDQEKQLAAAAAAADAAAAAAAQDASVSLSTPSPAAPSEEELSRQRALQQLNQFRFLGYLTKGGESQAFLTNGQAIYIVKQGEMLEGRVQVNKIEPENVVLSTQIYETGNHVQATIPLTSDTRG